MQHNISMMENMAININIGEKYVWSEINVQEIYKRSNADIGLE